MRYTAEELRYIIAVEYLPKIAALLSIFCSSILVREVLQDFKTTAANNHGGPSTISRILLSVSVADILFSLYVP